MATRGNGWELVMDNGMPYIKGCHPLPLQVKDERAMSASSSISAGLLTAQHPLLIDLNIQWRKSAGAASMFDLFADGRIYFVIIRFPLSWQAFGF
jgi:hypothetical protein